MIGVFHETGRGGGCEPNESEAATWYTKAADQGHTAAEASLGRLFLIGTQIRQDIAKAVHFLQRAAAKVSSGHVNRVSGSFSKLVIFFNPPERFKRPD